MESDDWKIWINWLHKKHSLIPWGLRVPGWNVWVRSTKIQTKIYLFNPWNHYVSINDIILHPLCKHTIANPSSCSEERLTLKTQLPYLVFDPKQVVDTKFSCFSSPPTPCHSFCKNWNLFILMALIKLWFTSQLPWNHVNGSVWERWPCAVEQLLVCLFQVASQMVRIIWFSVTM